VSSGPVAACWSVAGTSGEPCGADGDRTRRPVAFSRLPFPLQNVGLVQAGFARLPTDLPAIAWQSPDLLAQVVTALPVVFDEDHAQGRSGLGKDDTNLEMLRGMLDVCFPLPCWPKKALANAPLDVELVDVSPVFDLSP